MAEDGRRWPKMDNLHRFSLKPWGRLFGRVSSEALLRRRALNLLKGCFAETKKRCCMVWKVVQFLLLNFRFVFLDRRAPSVKWQLGLSLHRGSHLILRLSLHVRIHEDVSDKVMFRALYLSRDGVSDSGLLFFFVLVRRRRLEACTRL